MPIASVTATARAAWAPVLSREELTRAQRLRNSADHHAFVVGHAALRDILSRYLNLTPAEVVFSRTGHGKPTVIATSLPLEFSVSRHSSLQVCAIALHRSVGVDIEPIDANTALDLLVADLYFTPREREWLERQPLAERSRMLAAIWTRKEAVLKALGLGLKYPPAAIDVPLDEAGQAVAAAPHDDSLLTTGEWWVNSFILSPAWLGALAGAGRGWTTRWFDWEPR